ncbi:MAG: TerD family protein [Erysipelotrichaceae bacterium]|nr:TerD family protein [Erysipelotrichaceae bacterium]
MDKYTINSILLRRKQRIIIAQEDKDLKPLSFHSAFVLNEKIRRYGYVLSPELMVEMTKVRNDVFSNYENNIVENLKQLTGADVEHKPMYHNFPESVRNADDVKLFVDQLIGYSVDFYGVLNEVFHFDDTVTLRNNILFDGEKVERVKFNDEEVEYKVINLETIDGFLKMFEGMMMQNASLSETDKSDLEWFLREYPDSVSVIPETIPFKETMVFVYAILMDMNVPHEKLPIKNATDALRLAIALSDGDVSMGSAPKFRRFKRKEKTLLLSILNSIEKDKLIEDVLRHKEEYKRLIEYLGLFTRRYRDAYPKLCEIFRDIYDHKKFETFNHIYEEAFKRNDVLTAVNVLKKRPGVFARYLDKLLRDSEDNKDIQETVFRAFEEVSDKVEPKLLWDIIYHFNYRDNDRIAFPKGEVSIPMAIEAQKIKLSDETIKRIVAICEKTLDEIYGKRKDMSYVYVDEELKNYPMPFAGRSASKTSEALSRGSRLKIREGANYLRLFVYWIGYDVDLSVTLMDENFCYVDHVSYTNLRMDGTESDNYPIIHSGDITHAPEGASEFVDVDIKAVLEMYPQARYLVENVFSYSELNFNLIEKCFAGIMERDDPNSGEIFEPASVRIKADITGAHRNSIPLILDLKEREIIWSDICGARNYLESDDYIYAGNNVENNLESTALACKAFVNLKKVNIYEVIMKNISNRKGIMVKRKLIDGEYHYFNSSDEELKKEDVTIFSEDDGITPKDMEILVSEYL